MSRISIKITGAQGQGVNSVGEMCAKGLKRAGYCVFGYREYMSLIKGGHSSYQLDVSNEKLESTETTSDIVVCFNHHGLEKNWGDAKPGGVILHQTPMWKFLDDQQGTLDERNVSVVYMPNEDFRKELNAPPILGNVLITSVVWALLGRSADELKALVKGQFGHKGEKLLAMNFAAVDRATLWVEEEGIRKCWDSALAKPDTKWADHMLLTGSEAMGLGMIHGGCRVYCGYPMTPSSPLLTFIAKMQNETGMVVKQAEDEITAAQMMSGAMLMGTRAATGTSGGGFDLMTETVSLNAEIENPAVFVLAMRPGPATGLPTWTAQGDLLLAVGSAHGEFARCVIGVSDAQDCFDLMPEAFNLAEEFQTPVIVLLDKQIAEALYTQKPYDQSKTAIRRGRLVTDKEALKALKPEDRYDPEAEDGISKRWLPGANAATYCAQGDEHGADGTVDESAENAVKQMDKRMRKVEALRKQLPEPSVYSGDGIHHMTKEGWEPEGLDVLIISWGSNKGVILDIMRTMETQQKIAYMHFTFLWPLKTDWLMKYAKIAKKIILVEGNHQGQLGKIIKMECGLDIPDKVLKYDGRPFFVDELAAQLLSHLS